MKIIFSYVTQYGQIKEAKLCMQIYMCELSYLFEALYKTYVYCIQLLTGAAVTTKSTQISLVTVNLIDKFYLINMHGIYIISNGPLLLCKMYREAMANCT